MKSEKAGYLMLAPFYLFYIIFIIIPMIYVIYYSVTNYDFYKTKDFIGLRNYIDLIGDKQFLTALYNTMIYSVFTVVSQLVLGLLIAVALNKKIMFQRFNRVAVYIPYVISMVAASMIWLWILDPTYGFLNQILTGFGFNPGNWLTTAKTAMPCIIVMSVWKSLGYNMTIYLAGLQSIPSDLYEAAAIDGANGIHRFRYIMLPLLRPTTFFLFVTACINAFKVFEQVNIMTDGGPLSTTTTIVHQIYIKGFKEYNMGYASAMAVVLLILTMIITLVNFKFGNEAYTSD